jgi:hypothetical protein
MTTANDRSSHNESSILQVCSSWNIYLMHDYSCHNSDKDGDHNTDSLMHLKGGSLKIK